MRNFIPLGERRSPSLAIKPSTFKTPLNLPPASHMTFRTGPFRISENAMQSVFYGITEDDELNDNASVKK